MQNENFQLEDGETVQQKQKKLEDYLRERMPKFRQNNQQQK